MTTAPADLAREEGAEGDTSKPGRRRRRWGLWLGAALLGLSALLVVLAVGVRLYVRTDAGRAEVARLVNGLPLGPVGRLRVEGLSGDPLKDLRAERLQIVDARGPWLDAEKVEVRWRWTELLSRRFHARAISARVLTVLRDPVLARQPPSKGASQLPVAVQVDSLKLKLSTLPAFSTKPGLFDVDGRFALERNMAAQGRLSARSLLHAGDGLAATFQIGEGGRVLLRVDGVEAQGGALSGSLGLPADQRLSLRARADGSIDAGTLGLVASTGGSTPLTAGASWGSQGLRLRAQLDLTASNLTRDLAAKAGPQAVLTVEARNLRGDVFDVHGRLVAPSARLAVDGPLDWKVRSSRGLALALTLDDLGRWAPGVHAGQATLNGQVAGDPDQFDFKGRAEVRALAQGGYSLSSVAGPVALARRKDVWGLQADLTGAGGAGQGLVPGLLGRAPHLALDASRLADGRLLIKSLDASGAGVKLSGQGGRGLLGGLSFSGSAQLASLGALKPGLKGAVSTSWSASQPKGASGWGFTLNAHAAGMATGIASADHFLGAAPTLRADAAWGPGGLQVMTATLTGAAAQASVSGRIDPKGPLALDVSWRAQGPFDTGPLQVSGEASGTGHIGGVLAAPTAELDTQVASLALGRLIIAPARLVATLAKSGAGVGGTLGLTGPSGYGPATLKAEFQTGAGGAVAVHDLVLDAGGVDARGSLALAGGAPASADLTLAVRPGAFIDAGRVEGAVRLVQGASGLTAHLDLQGQDVAAPGLKGVVHAIRLKADGPLDRLPLQILADSDAPLSWRFAGSGRLDQTGSARQLTLSGSGAVRGVAFKTLQPAVVRLNGDARQLTLALGLGAGRADVTARQTGEGISAAVKLAGVDLAALDPDYTGAIDATLNLAGRGSTLGGALDATLADARSRDAPANLALAGHIHADLGGDRLKLVASATNPQGLKASLQADLPAVATAAPFRIAIDRTRPLSGQVSADGELRPLWDLLIGGDQRLSGHVAAAGALAGTLNAPSVTGHVAIAKGRYQNFAVGLDLQGFAANADFGHDAVRVGQVSGGDGHGGTLSGSGDIGLAKGSGSTFSLKLAKFRVIDTDLATATMSGDVTVTRDANGQAKLKGALKVDRADISPSAPAPTGVVSMDVVEINKPGLPKTPTVAATPKSAPTPPIVLDVDVRASRGVFVKGKGLNVELSLDAHVSGSAADPQLTGEARVVLGSYDFAGKRFDFDGSSVIHLASKPQDIRLNLTATRDDTTLTAEVHVTGTAARPEIKLSSQPVLPQDEVLSQVLFGSSAAQLTGAQAAELASTLASLSGGGGFDVLGRLRQFAGLDRLAFGQGTSGTGVSGGKYVSDNVYIELTGGGREGPSAAVEWRVRKNFSVISRVGTQGDTQLSIQYRRTFH